MTLLRQILANEMKMTKGKIVAYIRVSSTDQNPERQLEGWSYDKVFIEKASGKDTNRPQLQEMIRYVRDDDTILCHSMDRLARNLNDLKNLVCHLTNKKIKLQFIKENLIFTGEDNAISHLMLSIMGGVAEFEHSLIKERQKEGIEMAKKRGAYTGRKPKLSLSQVQGLKARVEKGEHKAKIANDLNISRETLYQYLKKPGGEINMLNS